MAKNLVPVKDDEATEKDTVRNSILGELILSDNHCDKCKAPYKKGWKSCVKCETAIDEKHEHKEPEKPKEPEQPKEPEPTGYECEKCHYPVKPDEEKCPKCGCPDAIKV